MVLPLCDHHWSKMGLYLQDDVGDYGRDDVQNLCVVDVPDNGTLLTIDGGICNTLVVLVQSKSKFLECLGEQALPQEGALRAPVECLGQAKVNHVLPILDNHKQLVRLIYAAHYFHV